MKYRLVNRRTKEIINTIGNRPETNNFETPQVTFSNFKAIWQKVFFLSLC